MEITKTAKREKVSCGRACKPAKNFKRMPTFQRESTGNFFFYLVCEVGKASTSLNEKLATVLRFKIFVEVFMSRNLQIVDTDDPQSVA